MPIPLYMLACESTSEDKSSNLLSVVTILERISFTLPPSLPPNALIPPIDLRSKLVAVWMREPGDEEHEFEHQYAFVPPPGNEQIELGVAHNFRFAREGDKHLQRFIATLGGFPPVQQAGTAWLVSKIRAVGTRDWVEQRYPVVFDIVRREAAGRADLDGAN